MAFNQIAVNRASVWGSALINFRNTLQNAINQGNEQLGKMTAMIDSNDHAQIEAQFGLPPGTGKQVYLELSSVVGRFQTDASIDNLKSAMQQFINFIG